MTVRDAMSRAKEVDDAAPVRHPRPRRHPRYVGDLTNAAFASDLGAVLPGADLWLHGHVYDPFDYVVAGCRVVANPLGYLRSGRDGNAELTFENLEFRIECLVDIPETRR